VDQVAVVAVVEDDPQVQGALVRALGSSGHDVTVAATGLEALSTAVEGKPDVVVLDLGLPDIDGLELLKMLRAVSDVPVIVATARDDDAVVVDTLNAGADDYVVKPFSAAELDARIGAVLRRARPDDDPIVTVGGLTVDATRRIVTLDGTVLKLTRKEFDLLHHLAKNSGKVVTKRELLSRVWDQPYGGADGTIDVHLSWLRRKLGETADAPRYLVTVRGVGIRLVDPADATAAVSE
jgi:DNA-binding response OmpR family regulator